MVQLLGAAPNVPALVMGRNTEGLVWNPTARILFAPHLPDLPLGDGARPSLAELVFLDPRTRELYANW